MRNGDFPFVNRFALVLLVRLVFILGNMMLIAFIFGDNRLFFNHFILVSILLIQIFYLIKFVSTTNRELSKFISSLKHEDISINYKRRKISKSFANLYSAFDEITTIIKASKTERQAQNLYLEKVINHVSIGIITVHNMKEIDLINPTAEQLLSVEGVKNWSIFKERQPQIAQYVENADIFDKTLLELTKNNISQQLAITITTSTILEQEYKIIAIKDINDEIEQKEFEAWQKLIRILTHEIMNSITPIVSLTETMQLNLSNNGVPKKVKELTENNIDDVVHSLKTIQKRSDAMLNFVDDYRKLMKTPTPNLETLDLSTLVQDVLHLFSPQFKNAKIEVSNCLPEQLQCVADSNLIEQVVINIFTNAIQAMEKAVTKQFVIELEENANQLVVLFTDSGSGMDQKVKEEVFVPFFTTKDDGSGIGLSLSKQIMKQHGGNIFIKKTSDKGTVMGLKFLKLVNHS